MRAPPLARMAAVAAPRPDADPVTIAHKPSFDIRFLLLFDLSLQGSELPYRAANALQIQHSPPSGINSCALGFMPPSQATLRTALVRAMAFAHHKAQEKTASRARRHAGPELPIQHRGTLWRRVRTLSPRPRKGFFPISPTPKPSIATTRADGKRRCGRR